MKPAGIILAAGESSRMGRDKALLPYHDSTFLDHLISVFLPRVEPLIVVLGHHADQIRQNLRSLGAVQVVVNVDYRMGMLTSLQAGLRSVSSSAPAVIFTLVDHPAVSSATIDRLMSEFESSGKAVVIPRRGKHRGHPVVLGRHVVKEILALPPKSSAKEVIHRYRNETLFVDVEDPGVLRDIDLPDDYEELMRDASKE